MKRSTSRWRTIGKGLCAAGILLCFAHPAPAEAQALPSPGVTLSLGAETGSADLSYPLDRTAPIRLRLIVRNKENVPITTQKGFSKVELYNSVFVTDPLGKQHVLGTVSMHKMMPPFFIEGEAWVEAESLSQSWVREVTLDLRQLLPLTQTTPGWYTLVARQPFFRFARNRFLTGLGLLGSLDAANWQGTITSNTLQIRVVPPLGIVPEVRVQSSSQKPLPNVPVKVFKLSDLPEGYDLAEIWSKVTPAIIGTTGTNGIAVWEGGAACLSQADYTIAALADGEYRQIALGGDESGWLPNCAGVIEKQIVFGRIRFFSLFALNSLWIQPKGVILSGDVGAKTDVQAESAAASGSLEFGEGASIKIPCFQLHRLRFGFTLRYVGDLRWSVDPQSISRRRGSDCIGFGEDLSIPVASFSLDGNRYRFILRHVDGLTWEIDVSSIVLLGNPVLHGNAEVSIEAKAEIREGAQVFADTLRIGNKAVVHDVFFNELHNQGEIRGNQETPIVLPVAVEPPFLLPSPGTGNITVSSKKETLLAAGAYGKVTVKSKGTLRLLGGTYHIRSLDIGPNASLICSAKCAVLVAERFICQADGNIGPASGTLLGARDIIFYVAGTNGGKGDPGSKPRAVDIQPGAKVLANIFAPNGTLSLGTNSKARGSFIARDVIVGEKAEVEHESAF